ncbi:N-acyl homoserine lactonase AttM [bacterium HR30]|nr:N-acyl homoserine lactonase AttM [bacterium HR30]
MRGKLVLPRVVRALLALLAVTVIHCQPEQRRLPYIPPKLENWPQPYRGVAGLAAHVIVTGFVELPHAWVYRGGSWFRTVQLPVAVLVLQHPSKGVVLIDTGLPKEVSSERVWPRSFLIPNEGFVTVRANEALPQRLQQAGIRPEAVRWVVQTNLRAIRAGTLAEFPQAKVVTTRSELDHAWRVASGYDPELWSNVRNWHVIDFTESEPLGTFPRAVDLLGDRSIFVIEGSGPTPGTTLVLARLPQHALLWASDVVLTREGFRTAAEPRALWSGDEWWKTFWRVKRLRDLVPEVEVLPAFDTSAYGAKNFPAKFHALPTPVNTPQERPTPNRWERILPRPW